MHKNHACVKKRSKSYKLLFSWSLVPIKIKDKIRWYDLHSPSKSEKERKGNIKADAYYYYYIIESK